MIRVYTASKLKEGPMWRDLCARNSHVIFHARWLKHNAIGTPDTKEECVRGWVEDLEDIKHSDALIVFGREGDKLRGALVEVGMALALEVPVIAVGNHEDYGTWQFHPGVTNVATLELAVEHLRRNSARAVVREDGSGSVLLTKK